MIAVPLGVSRIRTGRQKPDSRSNPRLLLSTCPKSKNAYNCSTHFASSADANPEKEAPSGPRRCRRRSGRPTAAAPRPGTPEATVGVRLSHVLPGYPLRVPSRGHPPSQSPRSLPRGPPLRVSSRSLHLEPSWEALARSPVS